MDQRRVRLGDVLDDYCPRERRVTNHAVVALVGNDIKLTRCMTCDTEHAYKEARVPARRQTRLVAALSNAGADRALIAAPAAPAAPVARAASATPLAPAASATPLAPAASAARIAPAASAARIAPAETKPAASAPAEVPRPAAGRPPRASHVDSVRRPLIRATLGRPDPAAVTRPAPVFTMREHAGRDGNVDRGRPMRKRRNGGRPDAEPNGNRAESHPGQFARSGYGKSESNPGRGRSGHGRGERSNNKGAFRSRGKSRSR